MSKPRVTKKQRIIMAIILSKAGEGKLLNIKELHGLLPYVCTYGAVRISIRFLVKHNVLTKKKSGVCSVLAPTSLAYQLF